MKLNRFASIVFLALYGSFNLNAQFGGGVFVCANCASEPTAVSIKIMHDLEYAKQILQYAIQVQQLADAIKNSTHGGSAALNNAAGDLAQLANVVQGGQALAYSLGGQDVVFRATFPGYQPVLRPCPKRRHVPKQICPVGADQSGDDAGHPSWRWLTGETACD